MHHFAPTALAVRSRYFATAVILLMMIPLSGCRICASDEDLAYPSYGGAWQRTIRDSGRVGSLFDPGGAKSSELASRDSAVTQDELERGRRDAESTDDEDPSLDDDDPSMDDDLDFGDAPPNLDDDDDYDPELEQRMDALRDKGLDDVKVVPGDALPPLLR